MIFRKPSPFVQKAFLRDIRKRAFGDSCNNSLSNLKTRNVAIIAHVDHGKNKQFRKIHIVHRKDYSCRLHVAAV